MKKLPSAIPVTCYDMDNERRVGLMGMEELSPTLSARMGTGGNNVPLIVKILMEDEKCTSFNDEGE